MTAPRPIVREAGFVSAAGGQRFRLVTAPADGDARGTVIWAPPFAEEMNKTRRMCARMAGRLAHEGWRVVQKDLFGCGDSTGEFAEATWAAWLDDVDAELVRAPKGLPVWLWCVRGGALFAPHVLARRPLVNLLLWQPVLSGAQHLQQFLRLHAGGRIVGKVVDGESTPAQRLRSGVPVEVGGYEINPELATGMETATFELARGHLGRVVWIEISNEEPPAATPAALRLTEKLTERGIHAEMETVFGPPFWQTLEIEECETLLDMTSKRLVEPLHRTGSREAFDNWARRRHE